MTPHMFIALAGSLATAVYFILLARAARTSEGFDSTQALISTHCIGASLTTIAIVATPATYASLPQLNIQLMDLIILSTLPLVLSRKLYLYAYGRIDVAYVTIFSPLTPIYAILIGIVAYHTWPSAQETIGIITIIAAIYMVFANRITDVLSDINLRHFSLPVFCAFASTIPTAFAALAQKDALQYFHPLMLAAIIQWGVCLCLVIYMLLTKRRLPSLHYFQHRDYLIAGLLFGISNIAFHFILLEEQASVTLALQRMSSVFQIFLAHLWLKQHEHGPRKIVCGILAFTGFMLLLYT